jgi:hypothetical protein
MIFPIGSAKTIVPFDRIVDLSCSLEHGFLNPIGELFQDYLSGRGRQLFEKIARLSLDIGHGWGIQDVLALIIPDRPAQPPFDLREGRWCISDVPLNQNSCHLPH